MTDPTTNATQDTSALDVTPLATSICLACEADLVPGEETCLNCGAVLALPEIDLNDAGAGQGVAAGSWTTFSLASLMRVVTLASIGLGVFVTAPVLGMLFLIFVVPSIIRTLAHLNYRRRNGMHIHSRFTGNIFATSLGLSCMAAGSALAAFFSAAS